MAVVEWERDRRRKAAGALLRGGGSPGLANPAFQGRIRAGLGSRGTYAACVGHWCAQVNGFGAQEKGAAAQAANLAGARRAGSSGAAKG